LQQRQRGDGLALQVQVPFVEAAQRGHHQAGVGGGLLEVEGVPALQRMPHVGRFGTTAFGQAEQAQRAVAVVGEVRMDAHPAAGSVVAAAGVQARQLVPQLQRLAVDEEMGAGLQRRMAHVHRQALLQAVALPAKFGCSQRTGGQRRLGGRADGEGRGQHRLGAGQVDALQCLVGTEGGLPELAQSGPRLRGIHVRPHNPGAMASRSAQRH